MSVTVTITDSEWVLTDPELGVWSRYIETMDYPIELYEDEWRDFPPLVAARRDAERAAEFARNEVKRLERHVEELHVQNFKLREELHVQNFKLRRELDDVLGRLNAYDALD